MRSISMNGTRASLGLLLLAAVVVLGDSRPVGAISVCTPGCCPSTPDSCRRCERPDDELWLLDDRGNGCATFDFDGRESLGYRRYDAKSGTWQRTTADEFFAGPGTRHLTCVWIHGDRVESGEAYGVGREVYESIVRGACDAPPLRFVIWSWSASQIYRRPLKDTRIKSARTPGTSYRLAWVLSRLPGDADRSLMGYSYGARVVAGALHLLAGGSLAGERLDQLPAEQPGYRAVMIATAATQDVLLPGEKFGRAVPLTERMLLVNNSTDRVLKRYPRLECATALGYCGLPDVGSLGPDAEKLEQIDAAPYVGPQHAWWNYLASAKVMAAVQDVIFADRAP